MDAMTETTNLINLTSEIVSAYVSRSLVRLRAITNALNCRS